MVDYVTHAQIKIDRGLYDFVNHDAIQDSDIDIETFWNGFSELVHDLAPINRQLIERRQELQNLLDNWHCANRDSGIDYDQYKSFLTEIGYLIEEGDDFTISSDNVDAEISKMSGPQLVVPITNARFALNAANARWGSLYDALYGTDAIASEDGAEITGQYNPRRGQKVVAWAKQFLNMSAPLIDCDYTQAQSFSVDGGKLKVQYSGGETALADGGQFAGFRGDPSDPEVILLKNNGLHIELIFDRSHPIGSTDAAGITDVILESALTTIMDCEDSVATVDAEDKILAYRNWLGLMRNDLTERFSKNGTTVTRKLNADREYTKPDGSVLRLSGRAVMLIRNVGHLMTNPSILDSSGNEVPEGIMDCVISALISLQDIGKNGQHKNSPAGSIYIVKPKMHGAEEVAFATQLFERTEQLLNLPLNTIKMGIMDEERRTTVNLKECIRAAESRVVFINTGFLDRTGDEIHTSMQAGPMLRKGDMKQSTWINAYENWNVDIGLQCGLSGKAQIGKGMWAMPDLMSEMLEQKINHPKSGATTAWVPSPTAATLHATHYHQIDVHEIQTQMAKRAKANLDDILTIPVSAKPNWTPEDVQFEIDNCAQTILGYVVRWIDQGIGCSKVPDIHDVGLMEDRATLRISSQFLANWILHDICSEDQVLRTLKRMAIVVDQQNSGDPNYSNMAPDFENSVAFAAACDLIFEGINQPSGYTEPILHQKRAEKKSLAT